MSFNNFFFFSIWKENWPYFLWNKIVSDLFIAEADFIKKGMGLSIS